MKDENSDQLWKIRNLFDILNDKFSKFYNPSEHLAIDEVIIKFKGRAIFRQYIPKKHKRFGIKIYKLCDETGYMYDMTVYLGRDRQRTAQHLTAIFDFMFQLNAPFVYYICHIPLHVSSNIVPIIRRIHCIHTAPGSLYVTLKTIE